MDINSIGSSTDLTARVAQQQNQAVQNTQNTQEERRAAESARTAVSGDERETNGARTAQPPAQRSSHPAARCGAGPY